MKAPFFASFATRLSAAVLVTAAVALAIVVGLTVMRLNEGLARQSAALGVVSEDQLIRTLDGAALLARAQINDLYTNTGRELRRIAGRNDVYRAVRSHNSVAIWELTGRLIRDVGIDNVIIMGPDLRVFGAGRDDTDILAANDLLQRHPIADRLRIDVLDAPDSQSALLLDAVNMDQSLMGVLGAAAPAPLTFIAAAPVYDDFGEVVAIMLAHRSLKAEEPALRDLSRMSGGIIVLADDKIISSAGVQGEVGVPGHDAGRLIAAGSDYWSRCTMFALAKVCAVAPRDQLAALRAEMVRVGEAESRGLSSWLVLVALVALGCLAAVTFLLSHRFARPLAAITMAVKAVARGDWKSPLPSASRVDEIGNIARAVAKVQRSLEERDRLRVDVANAETAVRRQEHVQAEIRRFDRQMRSMVLNVSEAVEAMNDISSELSRNCTSAGSEILEAGFVCRQMQERLSLVIAEAEGLIASLAGPDGDGVEEASSPQDSMFSQQLEYAREIHASALGASLSATNLAVSFARIKGGIGEAQASSGQLLEAVSQVADEAHRIDVAIKSFLRDIADPPSVSHPTSTAA